MAVMAPLESVVPGSSSSRDAAKIRPAGGTRGADRAAAVGSATGTAAAPVAAAAAVATAATATAAANVVTAGVRVVVAAVRRCVRPAITGMGDARSRSHAGRAGTTPGPPGDGRVRARAGGAPVMRAPTTAAATTVVAVAVAAALAVAVAVAATAEGGGGSTAADGGGGDDHLRTRSTRHVRPPTQHAPPSNPPRDRKDCAAATEGGGVSAEVARGGGGGGGWGVERVGPRCTVAGEGVAGTVNDSGPRGGRTYSTRTQRRARRRPTASTPPSHRPPASLCAGAAACRGSLGPCRFREGANSLWFDVPPPPSPPPAQPPAAPSSHVRGFTYVLYPTHGSCPPLAAAAAPIHTPRTRARSRRPPASAPPSRPGCAPSWCGSRPGVTSAPAAVVSACTRQRRKRRWANLPLARFRTGKEIDRPRWGRPVVGGAALSHSHSPLVDPCGGEEVGRQRRRSARCLRDAQRRQPWGAGHRAAYRHARPTALGAAGG